MFKQKLQKAFFLWIKTSFFIFVVFSFQQALQNPALILNSAHANRAELPEGETQRVGAGNHLGITVFGMPIQNKPADEPRQLASTNPAPAVQTDWHTQANSANLNSKGVDSRFRGNDGSDPQLPAGSQNLPAGSQSVRSPSRSGNQGGTNDLAPPESDTCLETDSLSRVESKKANLSTAFETEGGDARLNELNRTKKHPDERDELAQLKRKINECERLITQKTKQNEECKTAEDKFKTSKREYIKQCRLFARGRNCEESLTACATCSTPNEKSSQYNCVKIHQTSKCPELAGEDLKQSRERKEEYEDSLKEIQEEITEIKEQLTEKENELHKELAETEEEFNSLVQDMERDTRNAKTELEEGMKSAQSKIDASMAEQIQAVQTEIEQSLRVAHEFENAVTNASMAYQADIQKIYDECLNTAYTQLRQYRQQRRRSIQTGGYKISLSQLTQKTRMPFAQQDEIWLNNAKEKCLRNKTPAFKFAQQRYQNTLRRIEQKKEEYQQRMNKLQQSLSALNQAVSQQKNQLVQEYSKQITDIITQFETNYQTALKNYNNKKQTLLITKNKEIARLKTELMEKTRLAQDKKMSLARETHLIKLLESKNTPSNDTDQEELFSTAVSQLIEYKDNLDSAMERCGCNQKSSKDTGICKILKRSNKSQKRDRFKKAVETLGGNR